MQPENPAAPYHRYRVTIPLAVALSAALAGACHQGPPPETSGIPGFEPTIQSVPIGPNEHFSVIDSNDVVVASRDRSLIGGIFLLIDDAQLPYRRYFQKLPPRTAIALLLEPGDSVAMDSVIKASKAPIVVYEHVTIPRDNAGQLRLVLCGFDHAGRHVNKASRHRPGVGGVVLHNLELIWKLLPGSVRR